jgi:hypothetical protein
MKAISFTPEVLAGIVGLFMMLVFAYFPKLRTWYAGLVSEVKSYIMIGLLLATAAAITLLAQSGVITTTEPITWVLFVKVMLAVLVGNQPAYTLLPKTGDVKAAKLARDLPDPQVGGAG